MIKSSFALRRMVLSKHPATKRTRLPSRWVPKSVPFDSAPEEEAIKRLLPQRLHDQYVFKTQAALNALNFSEVIMA
jgi:hypothetical protein